MADWTSSFLFPCWHKSEESDLLCMGWVDEYVNDLQCMG